MSTPTTEVGYVTSGTASSLGISGWSLFADDDETPELMWPQSVRVFDRMRREDPQIASVLRAITLPIRRTEWRVDPAGASPDVARFIADNLGLPLLGSDGRAATRRRDRFSWPEHLRLALLQLVYGHSFFEQVYRVGPDGRLWLRKLGWRPPRTIDGIDVAADGGLVSIHQTGAGVRDRIGVDRLVAYVNDREGGNWFGTSLLRAAYKPWILKDRLLRVQAMTVDRNGLGIPIYTAAPVSELVQDPDEFDKRQNAEVANGLKIAQAMRSGETAGASIPAGANLTVTGVDGTLPDADKPIRYYDEQIARAVLAHFLNLGTETGSWALGSTFADFFTMSLQTVALQVADVASQHIVEDLVDLNWGPDEPAPRVVFDEIGARSAPTAEALQSLVQTGVIAPDAPLEAFMRLRYGLPSAAPAAEAEAPQVDSKAEAEEKALRITGAGTAFRMGATPESAAREFGFTDFDFAEGATSVSVKTPGETTPPEPAEPEEGQ